jgi:glycosyltransferase involved in cell wall biosynthesis
MDNPLVTILTPSFNQGRFLQDCIDSVANQTYRPIEHIIVDGGSTDGTLDILRAAPAHVRWVSEPDRGQSHAVNKALAMSAGSIIGWVNSDDGYFVKDAVERAVDAFGRRPDAGVVFGDAVMIDAHNRVQRHIRAHASDWLRLPPFTSPITQPAAFLRRSHLALFDHGLLREDLQVILDLELWLRLHRAGVAFQHIGSPLAFDRDHASRKVRNLEAQALAEETELAKDYGLELHRTLADRLHSLARRPSGIGPLWDHGLRKRLAIDATFKSRFAYLAGQMLLPHSLHLSSDEAR